MWGLASANATFSGERGTSPSCGESGWIRAKSSATPDASSDPAVQLLSDLNAAQRKAVAASPNSSLAVLAPPGSGKTRVLASRIAHLGAQGLVEYHKMLALTFTNKAATELRQRIGELVADAPVSSLREMRACTFHRCVRAPARTPLADPPPLVFPAVCVCGFCARKSSMPRRRSSSLWRRRHVVARSWPPRWKPMGQTPCNDASSPLPFPIARTSAWPRGMLPSTLVQIFRCLTACSRRAFPDSSQWSARAIPCAPRRPARLCHRARPPPRAGILLQPAPAAPSPSHVHRYEASLRQANALDFDDLLCRVASLLAIGRFVLPLGTEEGSGGGPHSYLNGC